MNILFTSVGRRTYLLKYFREQLSPEDLILSADMSPTAPAHSAADIRVVVPRVYAEDYIPTLLQICKDHSVQGLISLNDLELPILAEHRHDFAAIGTTVIISEPDVISICFDKLKTANFIKEIGLQTPQTLTSLGEATKAIEAGQMHFPVILKPRWGSGSIGIECAHDMDELHLIYRLLESKIANSILSTASKATTECILIQERLDGQEYGVDIMNDLNGNLCGVAVKKKLAMRAGETDKATLVKNDSIVQIAIQISKGLKHIGNLDVDIFEVQGQYYVLELNPRFGGGFPFSYEAGVNFPGAIIAWLSGVPVNHDTLTPKKIGATFAKCDYLVDVTQY